MIDIEDLSVNLRTSLGTGNSRKLRREGIIPGIVYGREKPNKCITINEKVLAKIVNTAGFRAKLYRLIGDNIKEQVLIHDIGFDYIKDRPMHVDFMRVTQNQKIRVRVPIKYAGHLDSVGVKRGGTFTAIKQDIYVYCPVGKVPRDISIDLTACDIGNSIHVGNIVLPEGVSHLESENSTVATITSTRSTSDSTGSAKGDNKTKKKSK